MPVIFVTARHLQCDLCTRYVESGETGGRCYYAGYQEAIDAAKEMGWKVLPTSLICAKCLADDGPEGIRQEQRRAA
jgi:hypothetical protein